MSRREDIGLALLRRIDPERAHAIALAALRAGLGPGAGPLESPRLRTRLADMNLPNPVGLAAGFDKNARAIPQLGRAGFGFLEVGAVTPLPQPGNPKPRLFRLPEERAVINRFGFNNDGMEAVAPRLGAPCPVPVGLNLGANKESEDRAGDFAAVLRHCGEAIDFATINVSSPNTARLREMQGRTVLRDLLDRVGDANAALPRPRPIFLKIAPDLDEAELDVIAETANGSGLAGLVATNTTVGRRGITSEHVSEPGGLSGQPLFERSTKILANLSLRTDLALIGVGGVGSAEQAYEKIRAGASAVQLYTALAYEGLGLVQEITRGLERLLERDGFASVGEAVASGRKDWL